MDTLLAVPCYSDLLGDQDDEDETECGRLLVTSRQGWHTKIDAKAALMEALAEVEEDEWPDDGAVEVSSEEEYNG